MVHLRPNRRDSVIVLAAVVSVFGYMFIAASMGEAGFPLDDAWIHQVYARNLAQTGVWAFVPGEPSAGSTSPLYTLLLAVGYWLGIPYLIWTTLMGSMALAGAGLIAARLGVRLAPWMPGVGLWSGMAVILAWHMVWAGASGMETMLFGTLTLGMMALVWRELDTANCSASALLRRGGLLGLLGAAAMLTRPEGAGLLGLLGVLMWLARPQGHWRSTLLWSLGIGLGWLAGFVPYAFFNLNLGGSIFPGTASAKQAEYAILLQRPYLQRIADLLLPILAGGQVMLLPGAIVMAGTLAQRLREDRVAALLLAPLVWALALIGLYAARLPAAYQHGRYVMPALPHLIIMGVAGTGLILHRARQQQMAGRVAGRALALATVVLYIAFWGIGAQQFGEDVRIIETEMVAAARWIAANIPPEDLLVVHDIGAVGYYAPRPILDLAGLVSPEVIPIIRNSEALWTLMQARQARYLMAFPDQVPGGDASDGRLCPVYSTGSPWAMAAGGSNMTVYALVWEGDCP
ncbi:MAG: hypothetical protein HPY64_12185 [Anaerolineae bacterium]|nr:hypothetical protein [Anaerolineae bacterium]